MTKLYPPQLPYPPHKPERQEFVILDDDKATKVYRDIGDNTDGSISLKEEFEDMEEEYPEEPTIRYWEKLSLQDIVDLAPPGTRLCDIILKIDHPRDMSYTDVSFTKYERNIDLEEENFKKALIKYEKDLKLYEQKMIQYNKENEVYNTYVKEQEIAELENRLNNLKKK